MRPAAQRLSFALHRARAAEAAAEAAAAAAMSSPKRKERRRRGGKRQETEGARASPSRREPRYVTSEVALVRHPFLLQQPPSPQLAADALS